MENEKKVLILAMKLWKMALFAKIWLKKNPQHQQF
jgi:hypothetical protein